MTGLAIASLCLMAVGAGFSAYSSYQAGKQAVSDAKAQAEMQKLQAEQYAKQAEAYNTAAADSERLSKIELEKAGIAQIQAEQEAEKRSRALAADIGSVYASAAGNGLLVNGDGSDSFANVLKSTVEEAQMDFSTIKDNGRMNIWEHQSNAQSLLATAQQQRLSAQSAMIGSESSLLGAQASLQSGRYARRAGTISAIGSLASGGASTGMSAALYFK